ncbi:hypothetical protein DYB26_008143 [Aphanomyces astaci]|uniref:Amidase domain-containing protein n=2 Tax=Aphanomyces astaci TaxID=112090 RepID=A0A3R6Z4H3_APHAT|nr:hypothetical protein DYB26_008143 [Aphanomyces astaci]
MQARRDVQVFKADVNMLGDATFRDHQRRLTDELACERNRVKALEMKGVEFLHVVFGVYARDGSIVGPASLQSVVGLKPTVGLVSRTGVIPISARQDSPGPMGRTAVDVARVLEAIAGFDPTDPASKDAPVPEYSQTYNALTSFKNVRVAISKEAHDITKKQFLSQAHIDAFNQGVEKLKTLGADIVYATLASRSFTMYAGLVPPPRASLSGDTSPRMSGFSQGMAEM